MKAKVTSSKCENCETGPEAPIITKVRQQKKICDLQTGSSKPNVQFFFFVVMLMSR